MHTSLTRGFKYPLLLTAVLSCQLHADILIGKDVNSSLGPNNSINTLYTANRGTNGGGDQSLQFGDMLYGTSGDDVIIGGLGMDVLWGKGGDDILIGGTEDFNPFNRDKAFGGEGDDIFLWAPGDGNDFFDGGSDVDVLILGLIGEREDLNGNEGGSPFFAVNLPGKLGAGDFDGIYLDSNGLPLVNILKSPGFCEVVEKDNTNITAIEELNIDHLVRFVIRSQRNDFILSQETANPLVDDGLRISMHIKNVEFLVCGGVEKDTKKIFDLSVTPAVEVDISQLPPKAQSLVNGFK